MADKNEQDIKRRHKEINERVEQVLMEVRPPKTPFMGLSPAIQGLRDTKPLIPQSPQMS